MRPEQALEDAHPAFQVPSRGLQVPPVWVAHGEGAGSPLQRQAFEGTEGILLPVAGLQLYVKTGIQLQATHGKDARLQLRPRPAKQ